MKILILTNDDMGLYKFRKELLTHLIKSGYSVSIAVPTGDFFNKLSDLGCYLIPFDFNRRGMNPFSDFFQIIRYIKLIKSEKPDVILTYTIKPNIYGGIACMITNTPYISNVTGLGTSIENGGLLSKISLLLYKIGLKNSSCIFFQNSSNRTLFNELGIISSRSEVIPGSGVNLSEHTFEEYPVIDNSIQFLFIGRIMKDKGIDELFDSFETVHEKYPNVFLNIVGMCDEDSYLTVLEEKEKTGYIKYYGQQDDVRSFIKKAHCTVLPSYHEGIANVLLESASTGRPVVATKIPGCIETFDDGVTGLGCDVKNVSSLADVIIHFIELPFETKKQMGINARKKMENEFDRSIVVKAYDIEIKKAYKNGGKENVSL